MGKQKKIIFFLLCILCLGSLFYQKASAAQTVEVETYNAENFAKAISEVVNDTSPLNGTRGRSSSVSDTDPYSLKRLLVKTNGDAVDFNAYQPVRIIKNQENVYVLQFDSADDTRTAKQEIEKLSCVKYVQTDSKVTVSAIEDGGTAIRAAETAPLLSLSSGLLSSTSSLSWGVSLIGADTYASGVAAANSRSSLIVAVIDSGVYASHPFLSGRVLSTGYDFVDGDSNTTDLNGHGTHIAGIIVDCTPGVKVKILPIRVLNADGTGYAFDISAGISYALEKGAKVMNLSLQLESGYHDEYLHETIEKAVQEGTTVVVGAGNDGISTANTCPADLTSVIVVGAIDSDKEIASFSNYGTSLDMVAPGVKIKSAWPSSSYKKLSGTSMAAPHVTALAAMLKMMNPSYTPAKIESVLKNKCQDLGSTGWDKYYAHGVPDFSSIKIIAAQKITLNKTQASLKAGRSVLLKATVTPSNASVKTVSWSSSDKTVAVVSSGRVIAVAEGTATITATTANGKKATCKVTVTAAPQMPRTAFKMYSYNPSTQKCAVKVTTFDSSTGTQVQLQNQDKKTIATKTGAGDTTVYFTNLSSQKVYYYRARAYYDIGSTRVYGTWSYRRAFCTAQATVTEAGNEKGIWIKAPSTSGVTKFQAWISHSSADSGFLKIGGILPGNRLYLSVINGTNYTSYSKGQKFYVYLVPELTKEGLLDEEFEVTTYTKTK